MRLLTGLVCEEVLKEAAQYIGRYGITRISARDNVFRDFDIDIDVTDDIFTSRITINIMDIATHDRLTETMEQAVSYFIQNRDDAFKNTTKPCSVGVKKND